MFLIKTIQDVKKDIDTYVKDFRIFGAVTKEPVPFENRLALQYKRYKVGDSWGDLFDCGWFKLTTKIDYTKREDYFIKFDMNCEGLLYNYKGEPVKGFTNGSSAFGVMGHLGSPAKRYFPLKDFVNEQGEVTLWVDTGMNDLFGNKKGKGKIKEVSVVTRNMEMRKLYYDLKCLYSLYAFTIKEDFNTSEIYRKELSKVTKLVEKKENNWLSNSLEITEKLLQLKSEHNHEVSSIGHAHLDLAWLWPIRETKRKGARTIANVLRLMETHEDFVFGASQPQLYKWIKDEYPSLYEQIKQRVKEGRWEVQGGMWVEADTNITGEESLVRQMLYGTKFFKEEFGIDVKSLWLPDVFGYSGNMPQIIKKSGMDYFMTIKISWNDTNKFPYHTFNWKGIDNTEVFAHMPPEGEYNSPANAYFLRKSMNKYKEKHIDNKTLNLFGVGDGGGGPAPSHVERIRRYNNAPTMPKVKMEPSYKFFEKINKIKDKFPTYAGELYLEKHRGTYTSQGKVKYYNRKMEQKLKTTETLLIQLNKHEIYSEKLEEIWKEILLYQFHDILPGSSIKRVYDECIERYKILSQRLNEIIEEATESKLLSEKEAVNSKCNIYNPLLIEHKTSLKDKDTYKIVTIAPMSNKILNEEVFEKSSISNKRVLENNLLKVQFNNDGTISSIYSKELEKEVLRDVGNKLTVYTDVANAWDINKYYKHLPHNDMVLTKSYCVTYEEVEQMVQHYEYQNSIAIQTITLEPNSSFINIELKVDWQSNKKMLRTAFPLNLETDEATFDIQFGHIKRSTKSDTKILKAQYEASGHNWVDMNNDEWGVSMFTNCKYGFKAKDNTLDLHLIKSTNYPAKDGDIGLHKMKYGLYIHKDDYIKAKVDQKAMSFNTYTPITTTSKLINSFFTLDNDNISYSTIKKAEDNKGVVLRLYESSGNKCNTKLTFNKDVKSIFETNMVENNEVLLLENENNINLTFGKFEVKTLKVTFSKESE